MFYITLVVLKLVCRIISFTDVDTLSKVDLKSCCKNDASSNFLKIEGWKGRLMKTNLTNFDSLMYIEH